MSIQPVSTASMQAAGVRLVNSSELYPALHAAGQTGLPMLVIENPAARAVIAMQGAHIMAFCAKDQTEMLWVSPQAVLQEGKPIRGGIPLCLPWFGANADASMMHGFARLMPWTLTHATQKNGETQLSFELEGDENVCASWPHAFHFRFDIVVGRSLKLDMRVTNRSASAAPLAFAWHTYFAVPKVAEVRVSGLEGSTYIDKMDQAARKIQHGEVVLSASSDRIYLDVGQRQSVHLGAGESLRHIDSAAKCAVVWNAWDNDKNIPDLGAGNHVGYLCVERGDVADYAQSLAASASYHAWMNLSSHD